MDVADDLTHVRIVIVGEISFLLALDLDNASPGMVTDGLALTFLGSADRLAFLGLQPFLKFSRRHVDGRLKVLRDLIVVVHRLCLQRYRRTQRRPPVCDVRTTHETRRPEDS